LAVPFFLSGCSTTITENVRNASVELNNIAAGSSDNLDIQSIIEKNEKEHGIPKGILRSIATVESGSNPYAVNAKRKTYLFKSKNEAIKFINSCVKKKNQNLSVGCMQIHYKSHKGKFNSIDDMLSPEKNTAFAAFTLKKLYEKYGDWKTAIKRYHANKSKYSNAYYKRVMKIYNLRYNKKKA
jgi:soluble lytic murein transglycosylase-like protein